MYIKNLLEYFEKTTLENPYKTAVISGEQSISFIELRTKALQLANRINKKCNTIKQPISAKGR